METLDFPARCVASHLKIGRYSHTVYSVNNYVSILRSSLLFALGGPRDRVFKSAVS